jgi:hypothetical protein
MKKFSSVFIFFLLCIAAHAQNKLYDESILTENEKLLCTRFKALKGHDRYDVMMKLNHLFPASIDHATNRILRDTSKAVITKQTLVSLLGEPDDITDEGTTYNYILYLPHCMAQFFIPKEEIIFHSYANCSEKLEKKKE